MIGAPRADVMAVIADFAAYPQWASAVQVAQELAQDASGRASRVRFTLDAGVIKDTYALAAGRSRVGDIRYERRLCPR